MIGHLSTGPSANATSERFRSFLLCNTGKAKVEELKNRSYLSINLDGVHYFTMVTPHDGDKMV